MKKVFVLMSSFLVLALFFAACSDIARITTPDNTQQDITSFMKGSENAPDSLVPLYADQDWQVGNVSVWHTSDSLCVKYELYPSVTSDGWGITETHLAIYDSESEIPQTKKGNPIPGQFPYGDEDLPGVSSSPVYCFSFSDLDVECGDTLAMAAHAIIEKEVCEMVDAQLVCTIYKETAWRAGIPFVDKGNWATYFNYEIQPYTVSLSIDPDGAGTTSGAGDYCAGDEVTIEATAIGETTFLNWTDDDDGDAVVSAANPYTFTMPASDVNYTANFAVGVGCYTIPFTENFDGVDDYDLPPEWSQECIPDPDNPYESSTWYVYDLPAPIAGSLSEMIFI